MSSIRYDVVWSPNHPNRFVTVGVDLNLYVIEPYKPETFRPDGIRLSDSSVAYLQSVNNDNQYLKCVSWYPKHEYDHLLAVGQANGKVVLTSFTPNQDPMNLVGKEFAVRHPRQCHAVAWNPIDSNLLMAGFDKQRTDCSILVWDVHKAGHISDADRRSAAYSSDSGNLNSKPLIELGLAEAAHSVQWFYHQPKTFIVGVNNKHLKVYDMRDAIRQHNLTPTKAVYGVCSDPLFDNRIASFAENQIVIWDLRFFEKPVVTLTESKPVQKIAWCPTRANLLASLSKDSSSVHLHDVQPSSYGTEEFEPVVIDRAVQLSDQNTVSSFCWHHVQENYLLSVTLNGILRESVIVDRITLNWSPTLELVWTQNKSSLKYLDLNNSTIPSLNDISVAMYHRAVAGYGFSCSHDNLKIDVKLRTMWAWLLSALALQNDDKLSSGLYGVRKLIRGKITSVSNSSTLTRSESQHMFWTGVPGTATVRVYKSSDRDAALQLCGWGSDADDSVFSALVNRLQSNGEYQRAAAIAVFKLKIREAIHILTRGAESELKRGSTILNAVAIALSGFSDNRNSLWCEMCTQLHTQLNHPYLQAMFAFLTADSDGYDDILNNVDVEVQDRIAFSCTFLADDKLVEYLDRISAQVIESGSLDGIVLTGLSTDGLDLLQRYVDLTGDVQTASLVVVNALPFESCMDRRVDQWIESYRDLLDQWRLWNERAKFDVEWKRLDPSRKPFPQVFISCNYCGKSVVSYMQTLERQRQSYPAKLCAGTNRSKASCPGCRKPLPRCAICLINMGTASGTSYTEDGVTPDEPDSKRSGFSSWFTWCQTCRHGGHAGHMEEWFCHHLECPVTGCTCKCMALDAVNRLGLSAT